MVVGFEFETTMTIMRMNEIDPLTAAAIPSLRVALERGPDNLQLHGVDDVEAAKVRDEAELVILMAKAAVSTRVFWQGADQPPDLT